VVFPALGYGCLRCHDRGRLPSGGTFLIEPLDSLRLTPEVPPSREGSVLTQTQVIMPESATVPDGQAKWYVLLLTFNNHRLLDAKEASGKYRRASHKTAYNSRRKATVIARLGGPGPAQDGAR